VLLVDGKLSPGDTPVPSTAASHDFPGGSRGGCTTASKTCWHRPDDTVLYPGHLYSPAPSATMADTRAEQLRLRPKSPGAVASTCSVNEHSRSVTISIAGRGLDAPIPATLLAEFFDEMRARYGTGDEPMHPVPQADLVVFLVARIERPAGGLRGSCGVTTRPRRGEAHVRAGDAAGLGSASRS